MFTEISTSYLRLAEAQTDDGPLFNPFTWREIQLRGLLGTGNQRAARIAQRVQRADLTNHANASLAQVCAEPVLDPVRT